MERLLLIGLLLINHSCVLGNDSTFARSPTKREQPIASHHSNNISEDETITNIVPNETVHSAHSNISTQGSSRSCQLPPSWQGKYFKSDEPADIIIKGNRISNKGVCREKSGDYYLFETEADKCFRCMVIFSRHLNVIQFKESECESDKSGLRELCDDIQGDASMYTMYRLDSTPIPCPFRGGPFKFSYNKGEGLCSSPPSSINSCSANWKLYFSYEACPDVDKTEKREEELHCLAQWDQGSTNYLVATRNNYIRDSPGERYRCFVYDEIKSVDTVGKHRGHETVSGYHMAQSGDASCTEVTVATEGAWTFTLTKVPAENPPCQFPEWMSSPNEWTTVDGERVIRLNEKNTSFHVRQRLNNSDSDYMFPILSEGTGVLCQQRVDISEDQVTIAVRRTKDCSSEKICLHLFKRSAGLIEMQMVTESHFDEDFEIQCTNGSLAKRESGSSAFPLLTLVSVIPNFFQCPFEGSFSVSGLRQHGQFVRTVCDSTEGVREEKNFVDFGCYAFDRFDIRMRCGTDETFQEFRCRGRWKEGDKDFFIVSEARVPDRSYCISYIDFLTGYDVSVSNINCERYRANSRAVVSTFNLTDKASCMSEHVMISGSALTRVYTKCDILFLILLQVVVGFLYKD